jgi:hypothetical protein
MTELRRKMLKELQLRNYSSHTHPSYIGGVADFASTLSTPDQLGPEHTREYQLFPIIIAKMQASAASTGSPERARLQHSQDYPA